MSSCHIYWIFSSTMTFLRDFGKALWWFSIGLSILLNSLLWCLFIFVELVLNVVKMARNGTNYVLKPPNFALCSSIATLLSEANHAGLCKDLTTLPEADIYLMLYCHPFCLNWNWFDRAVSVQSLSSNNNSININKINQELIV